MVAVILQPFRTSLQQMEAAEITSETLSAPASRQLLIAAGVGAGATRISGSTNQLSVTIHLPQDVGR